MSCIVEEENKRLKDEIAKKEAIIDQLTNDLREMMSDLKK